MISNCRLIGLLLILPLWIGCQNEEPRTVVTAHSAPAAQGQGLWMEDSLFRAFGAHQTRQIGKVQFCNSVRDENGHQAGFVLAMDVRSFVSVRQLGAENWFEGLSTRGGFHATYKKGVGEAFVGVLQNDGRLVMSGDFLRMNSRQFPHFSNGSARLFRTQPDQMVMRFQVNEPSHVLFQKITEDIFREFIRIFYTCPPATGPEALGRA